MFKNKFRVLHSYAYKLSFTRDEIIKYGVKMSYIYDMLKEMKKGDYRNLSISQLLK